MLAAIVTAAVTHLLEWLVAACGVAHARIVTGVDVMTDKTKTTPGTIAPSASVYRGCDGDSMSDSHYR